MECHGHFKPMALLKFAFKKFSSFLPADHTCDFPLQTMCHDIKFPCLSWIPKSPLQGNILWLLKPWVCLCLFLPLLHFQSALAESKAQVWTLCCLTLGANAKRGIGLRANSTWTFAPVTHRRGKAFEDGFFPMRWMKGLHRQLRKLWGNTKVQKKSCGRKKRVSIPNFPRRRTAIWYMFFSFLHFLCETLLSTTTDWKEK